MFCYKCGNQSKQGDLFCERCGTPMAETAATQTPYNASLSTPITVHGREMYAGFWLRVWAYLLDGLILVIPVLLCELLLHKLGYVVVIVVIWLYFALLESSSKQATLGKMALGLRVTDLNGQRISFGRATGRYFGKIISAIILDIGFMMAGWTKEKQALHDFMAGTLVKRNVIR